MMKLTALNSKEKKELFKLINNTWDCDFKTNDLMFRNSKGKIYLITSNFGNIDWSLAKIDRVGLYFGSVISNGFRLSIEGSQSIGPFAKKNIMILNDEQFSKWVAGEDIELDNKPGVYIIKHNNDFFGCGIIARGFLLNHVTKSRRINILKQL